MKDCFLGEYGEQRRQKRKISINFATEDVGSFVTVAHLHNYLSSGSRNSVESANKEDFKISKKGILLLTYFYRDGKGGIILSDP